MNANAIFNFDTLPAAELSSQKQLVEVEEMTRLMNIEDANDSRRFTREAFSTCSDGRQSEIEKRALSLFRLQRRFGTAIVIMGSLMAAASLIFFTWHSLN